MSAWFCGAPRRWQSFADGPPTKRPTRRGTAHEAPEPPTDGVSGRRPPLTLSVAATAQPATDVTVCIVVHSGLFSAAHYTAELRQAPGVRREGSFARRHGTTACGKQLLRVRDRHRGLPEPRRGHGLLGEGRLGVSGRGHQDHPRRHCGLRSRTRQRREPLGPDVGRRSRLTRRRRGRHIVTDNGPCLSSARFGAWVVAHRHISWVYDTIRPHETIRGLDTGHEQGFDTGHELFGLCEWAQPAEEVLV